MSSKSEIKYLTKLRLKKYRDSEGRFIAEGKRLISEGLKSRYVCDNLFVTQDFKEKNIDLLKSMDSHIPNLNVVSNKDFHKLSSTKNSQGIAGVFKIPQQNINEIIDKKIVCLENISDPGNVGTILRTCDWFGIKSVILSKECAELYNPKVVRASMGAVFNLHVIANVNIVKFLSQLNAQLYNTYFADMKGLDYRSIEYSGKFAITFCNEAFGPSKELKEICINSITIPKKGNIDSLNVAAAAAVILSHFS